MDGFFCEAVIGMAVTGGIMKGSVVQSSVSVHKNFPALITYKLTHIKNKQTNKQTKKHRTAEVKNKTLEAQVQTTRIIHLFVFGTLVVYFLYVFYCFSGGHDSVRPATLQSPILK